MAEALVMMPDITEANPGHPGNWEPLMVVEIGDDGRFGPGNLQHPRFFVMRMPNVTLATLDVAVQSLYDTTNPDSPVLTRRRAKRITYADIPQPLRNQIENPDDRDVTWNGDDTQLLALLEDLGPV